MSDEGQRKRCGGVWAPENMAYLLSAPVQNTATQSHQDSTPYNDHIHSDAPHHDMSAGHGDTSDKCHEQCRCHRQHDLPDGQPDQTPSQNNSVAPPAAGPRHRQTQDRRRYRVGTDQQADVGWLHLEVSAHLRHQPHRQQFGHDEDEQGGGQGQIDQEPVTRSHVRNATRNVTH